MGWSETWNDILAGGNPRWKILNSECHQKALSHFQTFVKGNPFETSVFCPLAGDDAFVYLLWSKGYSVTTIDLVPEAVESMKQQFSKGDTSSSWTKEEKDNTIIWNHESGRARLMVGDALQRRPELSNQFDAVYDKDSFGALDVSMRSTFCSRIGEYVKSGGVIYLECKLKPNHEEVKDQGPPFSLKEEDLMLQNNYGSQFTYVKGLDSVYSLGSPLHSGLKQTGHILQKR